MRKVRVSDIDIKVADDGYWFRVDAVVYREGDDPEDDNALELHVKNFTCIQRSVDTAGEIGEYIRKIAEEPHKFEWLNRAGRPVRLEEE